MPLKASLVFLFVFPLFCFFNFFFFLVCFCYGHSVPKLWSALCNPMDCSTPGFPVHHHLPELAQTHVHKSVMPSNHLFLSFPLLLLPSIFPSYQGLFQWFGSSHKEAKVLKLQLLIGVSASVLQGWFPLWYFRRDILDRPRVGNRWYIDIRVIRGRLNKAPFTMVWAGHRSSSGDSAVAWN